MSRWMAARMRWKRPRGKTMTLSAHEFIRRFLLHVLPRGFHRIRHYGLLATGTRVQSIERARELLGATKPAETATQTLTAEEAPSTELPPCPCCGSRQRIIETFFKGQMASHLQSPRPPMLRIDTS